MSQNKTRNLDFASTTFLLTGPKRRNIFRIIESSRAYLQLVMPLKKKKRDGLTFFFFITHAVSNHFKVRDTSETHKYFLGLKTHSK